LDEASGYLVCHRGRDQILVREELANLNEVQVDKSGRYLIVVYLDGYDEILDLEPFPLRSVATPAKASGNAFVHYDSGHGTLFHDYDPTKSPVFSRLATPTVFQQIIPGFWSYGTQDDHFSMQADNEGWALSSRFSVSGGPVLNPFDNEIVQIATDGSDRVRRIAHHRSLVSVYEDQPKASMSRDGRYVAFTSTWGAGG
jgi:carbon monoxide dehydrogenase subunit G